MQRGLVSLSLLFYGGLAAAAWVWRSAFVGEPLLFASQEDALAGLAPVRDAAVGVVAAGVLVATSRVVGSRSRHGQALARTLSRLLGPLSGPQILVLALASGIGEELFFRGALQPRVGLVLASVLFGLAHLIPSWPLFLWSLFAVVAGGVFGVLFETTGNLMAPVVAHALVNGFNLRWLVRVHLGDGSDP